MIATAMLQDGRATRTVPPTRDTTMRPAKIAVSLRPIDIPRRRDTLLRTLTTGFFTEYSFTPNQDFYFPNTASINSRQLMHQLYPGAKEGSSRNPALGMQRDGIPEYHMDHPVGPVKSVHFFKNRFAAEGARKKRSVLRHAFPCIACQNRCLTCNAIVFFHAPRPWTGAQYQSGEAGTS